MTLFWKTYLAVLVCFTIIIAMVSYVMSNREIADVQEHIIGEHAVIGRLMANDIDHAQAESKWPFENLMTLSKSRDFLFWWVVRTDGTIHLADDASFIGTVARDYFPAVVNVTTEGRVSLDAQRQCGVFAVPLGTGTSRRTFWLGFSTRQIPQVTRQVVRSAALFSGSMLAVLGAILYFIVSHFTNPIRKLADGAAMIGKGDLTHRVPAESSDEIGRLARSFNSMAEHLQTTTTSIDNLNREIAERERIENELRLSEEGFRRLFEYAPDAHYIHDLQGRVIDVNKAAEQLTGYSRDELVGHALLDLDILSPTEKSKAQSLLTRNSSGFTTGPDELIVTRKDSSHVIVEVTTLSLRIKDEPVVLGVARDITRRKKAEEEVRESREKYLDLFENANDSIYTMDLTGKFTSFNRTAAALLGYSKDEFARLTLKQMLTPESYATAVQLIQKGVAERSDLQEHQPWEFKMQKKDGTIFDGEVRTRLVWSQGQIVGIHGITRDITERKKVEGELRRSEERFRQVAECAGEFIWEVDANGLYTYANPVVERILGYKPEEVVGKKHLYDFFTADKRESLKAGALSAFARREPFKSFVNSNLHKNGTVVILETSGSPILDNQGTLIGYRGADNDITERKRLEDQAKQLQKQIEYTLGATKTGLDIIDSQFNVRYIDPEWQKVYGDPQGKKCYDYFMGRTEICPGCGVIKALETKQPVVTEQTLVRENNRIIQVTTTPFQNEEGEWLVAEVNADITERKQAEERIKIFSDAINSAFDCFILTDGKGDITYANESACTIFGYTLEEFVKLTIADLDSDPEAAQEVAKEMAAKGKWSGEVVNIRRNKETFHALLSAFVINDEKGNPKGTMGILRDITERKKAEEALRDSEAIFRAIFDHANDGILLADTVKKTFCTGNNTICQMLGYSLEEIKQLGVTDIHREEDLPYVIEQFERQVREEIAVANDLPVKRKDGSVFYADVNSSLVTLAGRTHILGLFRDITERKQAEDQIQQDSQSQSALNGLLSLSLDDLTTEEVLERAIDHMISLPWFTLSKGAIFLVDDQQKMLVMAAQRGLPEPLLTLCARVPVGGCVCGRAALSGEVEFVDSVDNRHESSFEGMGPHGHYCVPILSASKVLGVIDTYVEEGHQRSRKEEGFLRASAAVIAGIIQRKQAEGHIWRDSQIQSTLNKLLSLSLEDLTMEEMLKQAIEHITSTAGFALESKGAMFLVDDKQETLVMAAQRGMGEPLLAMCSRVPFGRCTCGRAARSHEVEFVDCVDERHENTFEGIRPHGHYCVPILSAGKVLGVINTYVKEGHRRCQEEEDFLRAAAAVLAGVIERKQAEKQQTALLQQLAKTNQELKDFVYIASHDLRAPVRKIVSFGQLLQESLANKLAEDDNENLEFMIEGAARMHELIEALLVYSRVSTKEVQLDAVDLNQILEELQSVELAVALEESHGTLSIPEPLPAVQGDCVQIRQLLQNLVSNGLKYHKKDVAPQITIRARRQDDGMVRVDVQDNGIGIEPQYHDKLFVMFRRLHSSAEYEGTGIGLAVCKKIIERHKGQIGIVSTPGEGSTFWFTLPAPQVCGKPGEPTAASQELVSTVIQGDRT